MKQQLRSLDKRIRRATSELHNLGKTPPDAVTLLRKLVGRRTRRSESYKLILADWSRSQFLVAIELAQLCALQQMLDSPSTPSLTVVMLALDYADTRVNRERHYFKKMIEDMIPDYGRGKKVREKGQNALGSRLDRYLQAEEFRRIDRELTERPRASKRSRSPHALYRDIAREYSARKISYKTVERRLKEFPVPLALVEKALGRKLD